MFNRFTHFVQSHFKSSRGQLWLMGLASFLESTIVPIPLETILIPYYYRNRDQLWRTACVVTLGCLLGASLFYWVGGIAMSTLGQTLVDTFSDEESFQSLKSVLNEQGFLLILATGISPIPFQIAMLGAGAVDYPFTFFLFAATIARGVRYYGLAALVHFYGEAALDKWQANKLKASAVGLLLLAALYGLGRLAEQALMN